MSCPRCTCGTCRRKRDTANNQHCRDLYYRRKARGLCVRCGDPSEGCALCRECRQIRKVKGVAA